MVFLPAARAGQLNRSPPAQSNWRRPARGEGPAEPGPWSVPARGGLNDDVVIAVGQRALAAAHDQMRRPGQVTNASGASPRAGQGDMQEVLRDDKQPETIRAATRPGQDGQPAGASAPWLAIARGA